MFLDVEGQKVLDFVKENTKMFDESHDWRHAVKVAENAVKILNRKDVLYLALLHDVCDHKYPESIPRLKLSNWIYNNIPEYYYIDDLIDKVSFSYQITHYKLRSDTENKVLEAVRDGDRYEALSIKRLELYSKRIGRGKEDAVQHCFDKILRLVPEGFIKHINRKTIDGHNVVVDYVNKYSRFKITHLKYCDYNL
tara:strand:- start:383 stop:967 length:585 start_codon:yes stop_codon:yes gene_type:complete